jgi:vacuolar protein sorting-associated protein 13A/C
MQRFADQFGQSREKLSQAGTAVASQATTAAQNLSTRSSRLSLDIRLKAPVVLIPQSSRSANALVVDLGQITISNSFLITGAGQKSHDGLPPVLDQMIIELSQLKVSRYIRANVYLCCFSFCRCEVSCNVVYHVLGMNCE